VDVRFVAATNVDLRAAVEAETFRSDLYYRLNVHRVHMPPLRERGGDVRLLVEQFLERYGGPAGVITCTPATWDALLAYSYPGNVRELEHIVQRAVAIAHGPELEPADLPEELMISRPAVAAPEGTVAEARERAERERLVATLARHHGEISAAARELQVSRTTMWRLMKKHRVGS
jgi:DNA-binding NtrC family response regulator